MGRGNFVFGAIASKVLKIFAIFVAVTENLKMRSKLKYTQMKEQLLQQLKKACAFWSYEPSSVTLNTMTDELLIEKVLVSLDVDDVNKLFLIFPKKTVKNVWKARLAPQEPYYHGVNKFLAYAYFGINNPERYIKTLCNQNFNTLRKQADEWFGATYGGSI